MYVLHVVEGYGLGSSGSPLRVTSIAVYFDI